MTQQDPDTVQQMRQALNAYGIAVVHPRTGAPCSSSRGIAADAVMNVDVVQGTSWVCRCFPKARVALVDPRRRCADDIRENATATPRRRTDKLARSCVDVDRFDGAGLPSDNVSSLAPAGPKMRDAGDFGAGSGKKARPGYMDVIFTRWAA